MKKSTMPGWRNEYEDQVLERLHEVLAASVKITMRDERALPLMQAFDVLVRNQATFREMLGVR